MNNIPKIIFLVSLISTILAIANENVQSFLCLLLIVFYLILYWGIIGLNKYIGKICGFFIAFLTFIRYFIIPFFIILDNGYWDYRPLGLAPNINYFYSGVTLTIFEMLFLGYYIYKKFPKWYDKINQNQQNLLADKPIVWFFITLIFGALIFINPSVLENYSLVTNLATDELVKEETIAVSMAENLAIIGSRVVKVILPIPFLCYFYKLYKRSKLKILYILSLIFILFFYGFLLEGNSRNSIIIPAVAAMFILLKLYPLFKRRTISLFVSAILFITILSLIWKSFAGDYNVAKSSSLSYWISYFEVYFAGIANVGKAVNAYQNFEYICNPLILFNDLFANVPLLNKFVDYSNTSTHHFFVSWGRTDQVIPAIGNGLFYFGYFLSPIIPVQILKLAHYFELKCYKNISVSEYVIYCYSCVVISYNIFNSISTMMMKFTILIFPLLFALYLSKKFYNNLKK